jgi:hypothetical protein
MMGTSKHSIDIDLQLTTESAGIRKGGRLTAHSPHLRHTQQCVWTPSGPGPGEAGEKDQLTSAILVWRTVCL